VGWLWFIGMLVPVIGLVQITFYSHADRYTYLPQIGLWVAGTWTVAELAGHWWNRRRLLGALAALILLSLFVGAQRQVPYWRDNFSLWSRVLECNPADPAAYNELGLALVGQGKVDEAIAQYREALRVDPSYAKADFNLGLAMERQGRMNEASAAYREALQVKPNYGEAHNNLGFVLYRQGRLDEAIAEYREALRLDPASAGTYNNLGNALLQQRQPDEAVADFRQALEIDPQSAEAHGNLANALLSQRQVDEAIAEYREALRIKPAYSNAHYNLANALLHIGRGDEAIAQLQAAVELQPDNAAYANALAFLLATAPQPSLRNGAKALELATKASQSTGGKDPMILRTLAAAFAESGQFPKAIETARQALQLVQANPALANEFQREIKLYEAGRRFESAH
jgi:tetratricopeptide (TPR) repeat protein